jgi:hypothetical protein
MQALNASPLSLTPDRKCNTSLTRRPGKLQGAIDLVDVHPDAADYMVVVGELLVR